MNAIYSWKKGIVTWKDRGRLYISVPFSWLRGKAREIATEWSGESFIGGPGLMKPTYIDDEPIRRHNPFATFTTRGCPNSCSFCAVPIIEGEFREIPKFRPAPMICDNNFLAASMNHIKNVIESVKSFSLVDFNQGLDALRFNRAHAELLSSLKCKIRFAFDHWGQETALVEAVKLCKERVTKDIGVYCLIGYKDNPKEARARLEFIRSLGIRPNPMRYQPLNIENKNSFIDKNWTEEEMRKMMKYYSRLRWFEHIPYDEFCYIRT